MAIRIKEQMEDNYMFAVATPQYQYTPIHKQNQLVLGTGQAVVVTGWTVKKFVSRHLEEHEYAAIGQLYSPTRGINILIRNLLANPHARYLVILDGTREDKNAGACQCLVDFLTNGFQKGVSDTGRSCWIINSKVAGYIDPEIPFEVLEDLRVALIWKKATSVLECVEISKAFAKQEIAPWGRSPLLFPQETTPVSVLPGTRYGHRIEGKTIAETWVKIIHRIKTTGTIRPTGYDGYWQELIDLMAVVTDEPDEFYFPDPNYLPCDRGFIDEYIPQILDDAPYREEVKYTYGQRLRSWFGVDQIEQVIAKLIKEIDAASAVMSLWDAGSGAWETKGWTPDVDHNGYPLDRPGITRFGREPGDSDHDHGGSPCLNHIWMRVVDNELSMTAVFRSNDMFSAWPSNAMGLRALQRYIRDEIELRSDYMLALGPLITLSQSAHIYDDCWENADRLIEQQYQAICSERSYQDPAGNFIVEVEEGKLVVSQTTRGGEVVKQFAGKDPLNLVRQICASSPAIQADHIGYLGIELQKAAVALQGDKLYNQDR